jgi:hypothetical protein
MIWYATKIIEYVQGVHLPHGAQLSGGEAGHLGQPGGQDLHHLPQLRAAQWHAAAPPPAPQQWREFSPPIGRD